MSDEELIARFLDEVEHILYLETNINDRNIAELIVRILEREYDI